MPHLLNRNLMLLSTLAIALFAVAYLVLAVVADPAQAAIRPPDPYCPSWDPYCMPR
jgi:hypothetical protein